MMVYVLLPFKLNDIKTLVLQEDNAVLLAGKSKYNTLDLFGNDGNKKADRWNPPPIRWHDDEGRKKNKYRYPDIAYIFGSWALSPTTAELLRPVISDVAELLPLPFNDEIWYYMNVYNRINALDKANTRYRVYSTGEVSPSWIEKIAFLSDKVPHTKLFTMPETVNNIYYAEHYPDDNPNTFKNVIEKNKLFGIELKKIREY